MIGMARAKRTRENFLFKMLQKIYPDQYYIRNGYYSFLVSPKKQPMQLDIFFPDIKVAFEHQGKQHSKYSSYFFKTRKQFEELKERDKLKKAICKKLGITLICIDYTKEITEEYIKMRIVKAGRKDTIPNKEDKKK
jgi:hypothetical protein